MFKIVRLYIYLRCWFFYAWAQWPRYAVLTRKQETTIAALVRTTKRSDERKSQIYLFSCMQDSGEFFCAVASGRLPSRQPRISSNAGSSAAASSIVPPERHADPWLCCHSDHRPTEWVEMTRTKLFSSAHPSLCCPTPCAVPEGIGQHSEEQLNCFPGRSSG